MYQIFFKSASKKKLNDGGVIEAVSSYGLGGDLKKTLVDLGKKTSEVLSKGKEAAQKEIEKAEKKVALNVMEQTRLTLSSHKEIEILEKAKEIVNNKFHGSASGIKTSENKSEPEKKLDTI